MMLVLHGPRADGEQLRAIRHIAAAYGVTLESREVTQRLMDVLPPASPVGGVVLSADLAGQWKRLAPGGLARPSAERRAPILLFGAEARDELAPLRLADHPPGDCRYQVTDAPEDAMELASSEFACGRSRPHSTVIVGSGVPADRFRRIGAQRLDRCSLRKAVVRSPTGVRVDKAIVAPLRCLDQPGNDAGGSVWH